MDGLPPWLSEIVEAGLAPFRGVVTDEELAWMREQLVARMESDPEAARLARDAAPRIPTEESGQAVQPGVLVEPADADRAAGSPRRP